MAFLCVAASPVVAGDVESPESYCAAAKTADLDRSLRAFAGGQGEPALVYLTLPSAGILSVDVTVPGAAAVEPRLDLAGRVCGLGKAAAAPVVLDRSATHLVLLARSPGDYAFAVAPQDRLRSLGDFKLRSAFAPRARPAPDFSGEEGEDPEEIEMEADPLVHGASPHFGKDGEEGEDPEEIEMEADPSIYVGAAGGGSLHARLAELCRAGEVDDHGDSFTCATFLTPGGGAVGEVRNGWGDDDDVFEIVVGPSGGADLSTVEIEAAADVEVFGVLYDRSGRRLETGGSGGEAGFRIVRTLPAGTYFLRVGSRHGGEGPYALRVDAF